jgi:hypothetical protein
MIVDQLERVLEPLVMAVTLLTFVGFVSLLSFLIYSGWLRRRSEISSLDAVQR